MISDSGTKKYKKVEYIALFVNSFQTLHLLWL